MSAAPSWFRAPDRSALIAPTGLAVAVGLFLLALFTSPLIMLALVGAMLLGLAFLRWPWIGVVGLIASVPVQRVGAIGDGAVTATRVFLLVALFGLLIMVLLQREPLPWSKATFPLLAFIFWIIFTSMSARDFGSAGGELLRWFLSLVSFLGVILVLQTSFNKRIRVLLGTISAVGAIEAGFGSVLGVLGLGPASFAIGGSLARAYGTFDRPNPFAGYLEMVVFLSGWMTIMYAAEATGAGREYSSARRDGYHRSTAARRQLLSKLIITGLYATATLVMLGGIGLSFSRGGWLGLTAGATVSVAIATRRYWLRLLPAGVIAVAIAGVLLLTLGGSTVEDRVLSSIAETRPFDAASVPITPENFAVLERMSHWQAGIAMFRSDPLTGVGAGNYNANYEEFRIREAFMHSQGHTHNYYLQMAAENGLPGILLFLAIIGTFGWMALSAAWKATDPLTRALALGALGTIVAVGIHDIFENLHVLNLNIHLSMVWAIAVVAYRRMQAERATALQYSRG